MAVSFEAAHSPPARSAQANIQVVQARAARLADTAALFQSLGGGWWNRPESPTEKVLDVGTGEAGVLVNDHDPL